MRTTWNDQGGDKSVVSPVSLIVSGGTALATG